METWLWAVVGLNPSAHYVVIRKISDILCRHSDLPRLLVGVPGAYIKKATGIITDLIYEYPDRLVFQGGIFIAREKS